MKKDIFLFKIIQSPVFICLFFTVFSVLYQGYYFGEIDQSFYIPYLLKIYNPSLYPNDLVIDVWYRFFPGYLWNWVALSMHIVPLKISLLVLHLVFRFVFFIAVFNLTKLITQKKEVAFLAVLFWATSKPSLGFDIFYNNLVQSQVAIPVLLMSSFFFLKNKYFLSLLLLSFAVYVHPVLSFYSAIIFLVIFLIHKEFLKMFKYFFPVFILTFPAVLRALTVIKTTKTFDSNWLEITSIRSPHHAFPFLWKLDQWFPQVVFVFLFFVSYYFISKNVKKDLRNKINLFLFIPLLVIVFGTLSSRFFPSPFLLILLPFHSSAIFTVFSSIIITLFIYKLIKSQVKLEQFLGFLLAYLFFFNQFTFAISKSFIILIPVFFVVILLLAKKHNLLYFSVILVLFFWLPFMFLKNQMRFDPSKSDWIAVQIWAKKNTDKKNLFIVPIYLSGFRLYSERPIIGDWKDGTAGFLSSSFLDSWWKRMSQFGVTKKKFDDESQKIAYNTLSEERVIEIAQKYNAEYFVIEKENYSKSFKKLKKVFSNRHFIVFKI